MFCEKCGTKVPESSKFCPKCGGNVAEKSSSEKEKKPRRHRTLIYIAVIFGILIIVPLIFYFIGVSNFRNKEVYKHPAIGFSIMYPKSLNLETVAPPAGSTCSKDPCIMIFKNPSYKNESVNWIFVLAAADVTKEFVTGAAKSFTEDVANGEAVTVTIRGKTLYKYINDSVKPSKSLNEFYKTFGFDSSREQSMYTLISGDSIILIGFRKPPSEAPSDYSDYLNIQTLSIP
ncbi:MAG: zinc-ribbon domain-containing protein [Candidatus Azambacteria bacterium]|nr:zinc-ribbon domain-containing protein [Candidatus Azambacteria bacterium]